MHLACEERVWLFPACFKHLLHVVLTNICSDWALKNTFNFSDCKILPTLHKSWITHLVICRMYILQEALKSHKK